MTLWIIWRLLHKTPVKMLTVPFECNFQGAQERKANKYRELIAGLEECNYHCDFFSLEVGSRGVVNHGAFKILKMISGASRMNVKSILKDVAQCAMRCSQTIFKERNNANANYSSIV